MKKTKLIMPITATLVAVSPLTSMISCADNSKLAQTSEDVTNKGVSVISSDLGNCKESTIVLDIPDGKTIATISIKIGTLVVTEQDVTINGNTITIPAAIMVSDKVTILSITFADEIEASLSKAVKTLGVTISDSNIVLNKDSTIVLNLPQGKYIKTIRIKIGNTYVTEKDVTISGNVITIPAAKMVSWYVTIISIGLYDPRPDPVDFLTCSWAEIDTWCQKLEKDEITVEDFCYHFLNGTQVISSIDEFLGLTRTIKINSLDHIVTVVGTQHDTIADEGELKDKKAALTFELTTLLSDPEGNKYTTYWNLKPYVNYDYPNTMLRANLTGSGTGTKTLDKTALEMLQDEQTGTPQLANVIKTISQVVATATTWTYGPIVQTTYTDKLFAPSYYNMTINKDSYCKEEGVSTYKYYSLKEQEDPSIACAARVKADVNGNIAQYWLTSPCGWYCNDAWFIKEDGTVNYWVIDNLRSISFNFCI